MSKYVSVVSTDQAAYLVATVAPVATAEIWPAGTVDAATIALPEAAVRYLETLDPDSDGHIDSDGVMWIGGSDYQLEVLHNA